MKSYQLPEKIIYVTLVVIITLFFNADLKSQNCTINGATEVCINSTNAYDVDPGTASGNLSYVWYVPVGGYIQENTTETVDVFWTSPGTWNLYSEIYVDGIIKEQCVLTVTVEEINGSIMFIESGEHLFGDSEGKIKYCIGEEIILTVSSSEDVDFVWDLGGVHVESLVTEDGIEITFVQAGEVEICAVVTNEAGCQRTLCINFEILDLVTGLSFVPYPDLAVNGILSICKNQSYYFENTSPLIEGSDFVWTVSNGTEIWTYRTENLTYLFSEPGIYTVSMMRDVQSSSCPVDPITIDVTVSDDIIAPIFCPKPVCSIEPECYKAEIECTSYQWFVSAEGTINGSSTGSEVCVTWHNNPGSMMGAIWLVIDGCTGNYCSNHTVAYIPLLTTNLAIAGNDMVCAVSDEGESNPDEEYIAPSWPEGGFNYEWSHNSGQDVVLSWVNEVATLQFLNNFSGSVSLSVTATQISGDCIYEGIKEITVYNSKILELDHQCFGEDIEISLFPPSGNVDWSVFDEFGNIVFEANQSGPVIIIPGSTLLAPGIYNVMAMMPPNGFPGACMVQNNFFVRYPIQSPVINGMTKVCLNAEVEYKTNNAFTEWVITGGVIINTMGQIIGNTSTGSKIIVRWDNPFGPHLVRARILIQGCYSDYASKQIIIEDPQEIMITGDASPCPDNTEPIMYSTTFDGATNILWTIKAPNSHLGSIVMGANENTVGILWHYVSEEITVQLQFSGMICGDMVTKVLNVTLTPFVGNVMWDDACANTLVELAAPLSDSYQWYVNGEIPANNETVDDQILRITFLSPGSYDILLKVTNPSDCNGEYVIQRTIQILPNPLAAIFQVDVLPCPVGESFNIELETFDYSGINNVEYEWSHQDITIGSSHSITVSETGQYNLTISVGECNNSTSHQVDYDCDGNCDCVPGVTVEILDNVIFDANACGTFTVEGKIDPFNLDEIVYKEYSFPGFPGFEEITDVAGLIREFEYNQPGIYPIKLTAEWECINGTICPKSYIKRVKVPVISDFIWDFNCHSNGTDYLVTVRDISRSLAPLSPNSWSGDIEPQINVPEIQFNAAPGSLRQVCLTSTTPEGEHCIKCEWISVPELPTATFEIEQSGFCVGNAGQLHPTFSVPGDVVSVVWDFADGSVSHLFEPEKVYSTPGTYAISLAYTTIHGCTQTITNSYVAATEVPEGEISAVIGMCDASATITFSPHQMGNIYMWSTGEITETATIEVTDTDIYSVTVTGANNCLFESELLTVVLKKAFNTPCVMGQLKSCNLLSLRVPSFSDFTYDWVVTGPGGFSDVKYNSTFYAKGNPAKGFYQVTVIAKNDNGEVCDECNVEVEIYGDPPDPIITLEVVNCMPSQVVLSANTIVDWKKPGQSTITAMELYLTNEGGSVYTATFTDEITGCKSNASETIPSSINFTSMTSGCGICTEDLQQGLVFLEGIDGVFDEWHWRVDGQMLTGPGFSGTFSLVEPLQITNNLLNKIITLYVKQGLCMEESPPYYFEVIECLDCPDDLGFEWIAGLESIDCLGGGLDGELIIQMAFVLYMPEGFEFCNQYPEFEDGTFVYDNYTFDPVTSSLHISGQYHITDVPGFNEDYVIRGELKICPEGNQEGECVGVFEIAQMNCPGACAEDPCANVTCNNVVLELQELSDGVAYLLLTVNLPLPSSGCNYGNFTIEVEFIDGPMFIHTVNPLRVEPDGDYSFRLTLNNPSEVICADVEIKSSCPNPHIVCTAQICTSVPDFSGNPPISARTIETAMNIFHIIPNPVTNEYITLYCENLADSELNVTVFDLNGRAFIDQLAKFNDGKATVDINILSGGFYFSKVSLQGKIDQYVPFIIIK